MATQISERQDAFARLVLAYQRAADALDTVADPAQIHRLCKELDLPGYSDAIYPPIAAAFTHLLSADVRQLLAPEELKSAASATAAGALLYAMAWKNGDLPKLDHIIYGYLDALDDHTFQKERTSVVFYQFGRHLARPESEPIVDRHAVRAQQLLDTRQHWCLDIEAFDQMWLKDGPVLRGGKVVNAETGDAYRRWILAKAPAEGSSQRSAWLTAADRLLYSLGKAALKLAPDNLEAQE